MVAAIATPVVIFGDAIGRDVYGMYQALHQLGIASLVIADTGHYDGLQLTAPAQALASRQHIDFLIMHYSIGWEAGWRLLAQLQCRKIIKYHNITPPGLMAPYSDHVAGQCAAGLQSLPRLIAHPVVAFWADSTFNALDLLNIGCSKVECLPPFTAANELEMTVGVVRPPRWSTSVLMVGRLVPNKNHLAALEAFACYRQRYDRLARLTIVGMPHGYFANYQAELVAAIKHLELGDSVSFVGHINQIDLKSHYLDADVLLSTSLHEGFCVPLVEAMAMRVPVVALAGTAVTETLGDAGILVDRSAGPLKLAAALATALASAGQLAARGRRRYLQFYHNAVTAESFGRLLTAALS